MFMTKRKTKTLIEICWISMNLKKDSKITISCNLYYINSGLIKDGKDNKKNCFLNW